MGGVISDIEDVVTGTKHKDRQTAIEQAALDRQFAMDLWERQFGPVSDQLRSNVMNIIGGTHGHGPSWEEQFKRDLYESAGVGAKGAEQVALESLKQKVGANPRAMSGRAYTQGIQGIQKQTGDSSSAAYASAKSQAKLAPVNIGLSFMGRTPFNPQTNWMPGYGAYGNPEFAKLAGSGLGQLVKYGKSAYNRMFADRTPSDYEIASQSLGNVGTNPDYIGYEEQQGLW